MLKLREEGEDSEDTVPFAGQSALGHPGWQKGWDGGAEREQGSYLPLLGPE